MNYLKGSFDSVSVIILSYNQKNFLKRCIDSVINQEHKPYQIIVVDNASSDGTVDFLKNFNLTVIKNSCNLGFAKAVNRGIEKICGRYVLLITADIALALDCTKAFLDYIKNRDNIGLLSGHLYNYYNKELIFSGQKISLGWNFKQENMQENGSVNYTDLIPGAFIFTRADLLRQFKGFDERFFFYSEDLDLTLRFKRAGFRNLIIPQAKAYHLEGGRGIEKYETDKKIQFELVKNIIIIYFKHAPLFWLAIYFIRYMFLGFIKNIFNKKMYRITLETRRWAMCHLIDLIKARYYG